MTILTSGNMFLIIV